MLTVNERGEVLYLDENNPESEPLCVGDLGVVKDALAEAGLAVVPVKSLQFWLELATIHPRDSAPHIEALLQARGKE